MRSIHLFTVLFSSRAIPSEPTPEQAATSSGRGEPKVSSPVAVKERLLPKDQILSKIKQLDGDIKKANQKMNHVAVRNAYYQHNDAYCFPSLLKRPCPCRLQHALVAADAAEQESVRAETETLQIHWPEKAVRHLAIDANMVAKIYGENRVAHTKVRDSRVRRSGGVDGVRGFTRRIPYAKGISALEVRLPSAVSIHATFP